MPESHRTDDARGISARERDARLAGLGRVTGELLHDIVGMVGILSSRAALIREDDRMGRTVSEEVGRLARDCDHLKSMVIDIMDELRGRSRSPEVTFSVGATLQEVVDRWLVGSPSITTRLSSSAPDTTHVTGAKTFFTRAVANLLQNAARHARSQIRISVDPEERNGRRGVVIGIEDDGDGIPDELRASLFEPFTHGDPGGTGLGLSLVEWSVSQLRGTVRFQDESELGGARFEIWMPTVLSRALPAEVPEKAAGPDSTRVLAGRRVTVVDDEAMIRRVYRRLLERAGATVADVVPRADLTSEALADEIAASDPDVVLLDLNLSGRSGVEVWRTLLERHAVYAQRVLFLSGDIWQEENEDGDMPPRISKLIEWEDLLARIEGLARWGKFDPPV
jgi:CheY-like chemotaxis protein